MVLNDNVTWLCELCCESQSSSANFHGFDAASSVTQWLSDSWGLLCTRKGWHVEWRLSRHKRLLPCLHWMRRGSSSPLTCWWCCDMQGQKVWYRLKWLQTDGYPVSVLISAGFVMPLCAHVTYLLIWPISSWRWRVSAFAQIFLPLKLDKSLKPHFKTKSTLIIDRNNVEHFFIII